MTNIIAFAPQYNTKGRKDATGAFQREAKAFMRLHGAKGLGLFLVDNHRCDFEMRDQVLYAIRSEPFIDTVAFFCHGLSKSIQFGFDTLNVDVLAKTLEERETSRVVLYACNAAGGPGVGGDGGFADLLRDAMCRAGAISCQVDAHTTAGHTTRNPYVRRFEGRLSPVGGVGGYYLVEPKSKLWRPWVRAMKDDKNTLRYEFPFMQVGQIHERLVKG